MGKKNTLFSFLINLSSHRSFSNSKKSHYNLLSAENGSYKDKQQHLINSATEKAPVNIYKTMNGYEMMVFAPGRLKGNFRLQVKGAELVISYKPPENFPRPEWVRREYSRGGFERSFGLDEAVDTASISAKYEDGVLQVILPVLEGKEMPKYEITVS